MTTETIPFVAGMCATCKRPMWAGTKDHQHKGIVVVSSDGNHCDACLRYIRETGKDPRHKVGTPAERIPAEWAETNDSWRDDPFLMSCSGVGPQRAFDPEGFPEELQAMPEGERDELIHERRYYAEKVCDDCMVKLDCRATALKYGYEGLWGGWFFTRTRWIDMLRIGVKGPTRHMKAQGRARMIGILARQGLDAVGQPLPTDNDGEAVA